MDEEVGAAFLIRHLNNLAGNGDVNTPDTLIGLFVLVFK